MLIASCVRYTQVANSLHDMRRLQGNMVQLYKTDTQSEMIKTASMIPCGKLAQLAIDYN